MAVIDEHGLVAAPGVEDAHVEGGACGHVARDDAIPEPGALLTSN
jgi:hypothetical protein